MYTSQETTAIVKTRQGYKGGGHLIQDKSIQFKLYSFKMFRLKSPIPLQFSSLLHVHKIPRKKSHDTVLEINLPYILIMLIDKHFVYEITQKYSFIYSFIHSLFFSRLFPFCLFIVCRLET